MRANQSSMLYRLCVYLPSYTYLYIYTTPTLNTMSSMLRIVIIMHDAKQLLSNHVISSN